MSRGAVIGVAACVALLIAGVVFREDQRRFSATSYGTTAGGHRALFDLLGALDLPARRSFEPPELLEPGTVWWVEPWDACSRELGELHTPPPLGAPLEDFVRRGGRAVVFLRARRALYAPDLGEPCTSLAGLALPDRRVPEPEGGGEPESILDALGSAPVAQRVTGPLVSGSRTLVVPPLVRFAEAGAWKPALLLDGDPFGLQAALGEGRLLVLADGAFLRNAWLDAGEGAPLAVDLVRELGVPAIDEHSHGLRLPQSRTVLLTRLGAVPIFVALLVLAVLFVWRRAAVPVGMEPPVPSARPALDEFATSLASLYARSRDFPSLAERYRQLALERLRSHLRLPPETPGAVLVERLAQRRVPRERLALLQPGAPVRGRAEWLQRARDLDALVEEVCR